MKKESKLVVKPVNPGGLLSSGLQQRSQKLAQQYSKNIKNKKMGK